MDVVCGHIAKPRTRANDSSKQCKRCESCGAYKKGLWRVWTGVVIGTLQVASGVRNTRGEVDTNQPQALPDGAGLTLANNP